MKLGNLEEFTPRSKATAKRKGRGPGTGNGKTAGKGHKGQKARAGGVKRPGFEGGQTPLYMRLPKPGFNNKRFAKVYTEVDVGTFSRFADGDTVTAEALKEKGLIRKLNDGIVVLGNGELTSKVKIIAIKATKGAMAKIEAAGASFEGKYGSR
ncbi:MAG: 50S ribosomal protein L15 [Oscillospiraceae bacterium]|nr:50S ribosomal protein L15 [Oscillospiraceae bacterium]